MADGVRKGLVWNIKRNLLTLPANELFAIAKALVELPGMDQSRRSQLTAEDEEGCFNYINDYLYGKALLESEDAGMRQLHDLKGIIDLIM